MKRLLVFFLTLLATSIALANQGTQDYCADLGGDWIANNKMSGQTVDLTGAIQQDANGTVTGQFQYYCPGVGSQIYNITSGTSLGQGWWSFSGTVVSGSSCHTVGPFYANIALGDPGCMDANIYQAKSTSSTQVGSQTQGSCLVPNAALGYSGENATTFFRWDSPGLPSAALAHFRATMVLPNSSVLHFNYGGRQVTVTNGSDVTSDCINNLTYPGEPWPLYDNGIDYVQGATNTIDDDIGWSTTTDVDDTRDNARNSYPCQRSYRENMWIDCQQGDGFGGFNGQPTTTIFEHHTNTMQLDNSPPYPEENTVSLYRNGTAATYNGSAVVPFGMSTGDQSVFVFGTKFWAFMRTLLLH